MTKSECNACVKIVGRKGKKGRKTREHNQGTKGVLKSLIVIGGTFFLYLATNPEKRD